MGSSCLSGHEFRVLMCRLGSAFRSSYLCAQNLRAASSFRRGFCVSPSRTTYRSMKPRRFWVILYGTQTSTISHDLTLSIILLLQLVRLAIQRARRRCHPFKVACSCGTFRASHRGCYTSRLAFENVNGLGYRLALNVFMPAAIFKRSGDLVSSQLVRSTDRC